MRKARVERGIEEKLARQVVDNILNLARKTALEISLQTLEGDQGDLVARRMTLSGSSVLDTALPNESPVDPKRLRIAIIKTIQTSLRSP